MFQKHLFKSSGASCVIISFEPHNNPVNRWEDMVGTDPKTFLNCTFIFILKYITCSLNKLQKTQLSVKKKIQLPVNKVTNTFILYKILHSIYMY